VGYIAFLILVALLLDIRRQLRSSGSVENKQTSGSEIIIDTSALIDGRICEITKTGFISADLVVPSVVLRELQMLADGRDVHKRERARAGLDTVAELQSLSNITTVIDESLFANTTTDDALILLAKKRNAQLCTTDFNLNKVAVAEGVQVLNVNELAQTMRPNILPGEIVEVKILQKGESANQGVGYLDDGTMTVVDGASRMKGKVVTVEVDRMIQTKAGKMVFGTLISKK
jgi:uncharacterized protein YacL